MELQIENGASVPRPSENGLAVDSASELAETERQTDELHGESSPREQGVQNVPVTRGDSNVSPSANQSNSDEVVNDAVPPSEQSSQTPSVTSEQLSKLLPAFSALERSNNEMKTTIAENCRLIADLRATCALLEKKNTEFEHGVMKLASSDDRIAANVNRLSSEVAGLVTASANALKQEGGKTANDVTDKQTADASSQPTVEQRIADLEVTSADSSRRIAELTASVSNIERDLQRFIRRHSLVVEHLCPKEDRSAQDAFLVFIKSVLGVTADESDIDGLHLIDDAGAGASGSGSPAKSADTCPRPVLVTFTCYRTRMKVYKAWLSYRVGASGDSKAAVGALSGERGQGVCIREYLTAAQEMVYRAANDIRHKRPDMIADCWTFRGRTFVRTAQGDVREFSEVDQMMTKDDSRHRVCIVM